MKEHIVTPEYLLTHGFMQYKSAEEGDCCDIPFMNEDDLHFREKELCRQLFVVIFPAYHGDPANGYHCADVYVQEDVGCGFIEIPFPWSELTVEYFESVYYGIRGEKPKYTGPIAEDAEYEIITPKAIIYEEPGEVKKEDWDKLKGTP